MHDHSSVRMVARRGELPAGSPDRAPDAAFIRRLKQVDPKLELYWHPVRKSWVCYRLARKGPTPSDDTLFAISPVEKLTERYIHWLQKNDLVSKYGVGGGRAVQLQDQWLEAEKEQRDAGHDRSMAHLLDEAKADITMCKNERTTFSSAVFEGMAAKRKRNPVRDVGAATGV